MPSKSKKSKKKSQMSAADAAPSDDATGATVSPEDMKRVAKLLKQTKKKGSVLDACAEISRGAADAAVGWAYFTTGNALSPFMSLFNVTQSIDVLSEATKIVASFLKIDSETGASEHAHKFFKDGSKKDDLLKGMERFVDVAKWAAESLTKESAQASEDINEEEGESKEASDVGDDAPQETKSNPKALILENLARCIHDLTHAICTAEALSSYRKRLSALPSAMHSLFCTASLEHALSLEARKLIVGIVLTILESGDALSTTVVDRLSTVEAARTMCAIIGDDGFDDVVKSKVLELLMRVLASEANGESICHNIGNHNDMAALANHMRACIKGIDWEAEEGDDKATAFEKKVLSIEQLMYALRICATGATEWGDDNPIFGAILAAMSLPKVRAQSECTAQHALLWATLHQPLQEPKHYLLPMAHFRFLSMRCRGQTRGLQLREGVSWSLSVTTKTIA